MLCHTVAGPSAFGPFLLLPMRIDWELGHGEAAARSSAPMGCGTRGCDVRHCSTMLHIPTTCLLLHTSLPSLMYHFESFRCHAIFSDNRCLSRLLLQLSSYLPIFHFLTVPLSFGKSKPKTKQYAQAQKTKETIVYSNTQMVSSGF